MEATHTANASPYFRKPLSISLTCRLSGHERIGLRVKNMQSVERTTKAFGKRLEAFMVTRSKEIGVFVGAHVMPIRWVERPPYVLGLTRAHCRPLTVRFTSFTAMWSRSSARSGLPPASGLDGPDESAIGAEVAAADPECSFVFFRIELQGIGRCLTLQALWVVQLLRGERDMTHAIAGCLRAVVGFLGHQQVGFAIAGSARLSQVHVFSSHLPIFLPI